MKVFIQANNEQYLGALLAKYSLLKNSNHSDLFSVEIMNIDKMEKPCQNEGKYYLRQGNYYEWTLKHIQSFTVTRFLPPQLMNYEGRSLVIDPDVFAVGDVYELLEMDMQDKAVMGIRKKNSLGKESISTSVMLLDCSKLKHWRWDENFQAMFDFKFDYHDWMWLLKEDPKSFGELDKCWNDIDHLDENTKLIHFSRRITQPWKTGLVFDSYRPKIKYKNEKISTSIKRQISKLRTLLKPKVTKPFYEKNPHRNQCEFFFSLLKSALNDGALEESFIREEVSADRLRSDIFDVLDNIP